MSKGYRGKKHYDRDIVSIISYLIRQFCFPNPFSNIVKDPNMATIVNWICGGIFIPLSYILTGTWYSGGVKIIGIIGFFVNYALLTGLFLLITYFFNNLYIVTALFLLGYIMLCLIEGMILGKKYSF